MGKGSKRRPMRISDEEYTKKWKDAFGKQEAKLPISPACLSCNKRGDPCITCPEHLRKFSGS